MENKIKQLRATLESIKSNYEKLTASGCSVHKFNRLKSNTEYCLNKAESEIAESKEQYVRYAELSLTALDEWVGKRIPILNTDKCDINNDNVPALRRRYLFSHFF